MNPRHLYKTKIPDVVEAHVSSFEVSVSVNASLVQE